MKPALDFHENTRVNNEVPSIQSFTFIAAQDAISAAEMLLIGGVCQWERRYLRGSSEAFCLVSEIWPKL